MTCSERPSPMLGNGYSQMCLGRGRGSFAEFSSVRNALKNLNYQPQVDPGSSSFISSSALPQSTYAEEASTFNNSMSISSTSPNTVYSNYSPSHSSADYNKIGSTDSRNSDVSSTKAHCWQGDLRGTKGFQNTYVLPVGNDGLPRCPPQQYTDAWGSASGSASAWDLAANTISPKMLALNVSSASLLSSTSSQDSVLALSDSSAAMTVHDLGVRVPEHLQIVEPQPRRHRHVLPDCAPTSRRIVSAVPGNDFPPSRNAKKRPMKVAKIPIYTRRKSSPPVRSTLTTFYSPSPSPQLSEPCSPRSVATPKRIESNPLRTAISSRIKSGAQLLRDREAQDEFLVKSKLAGMSYRDIRQQGSFTEAESTLRGRFRALTKDKTQRVRKPEWEDNDVSPNCLRLQMYH